MVGRRKRWEFRRRRCSDQLPTVGTGGIALRLDRGFIRRIGQCRDGGIEYRGGIGIILKQFRRWQVWRKRRRSQALLRCTKTLIRIWARYKPVRGSEVCAVSVYNPKEPKLSKGQALCG